MPQNISSFQTNATLVRAINVNLSDWGNYSNNPIEIQYDQYTQTLNINVHRALQDFCSNQHAFNNVVNNMPIMQDELNKLKIFIKDWSELIDAYHKNEAVRKTIDQAKLVAGIAKDE